MYIFILHHRDNRSIILQLLISRHAETHYLSFCGGGRGAGTHAKVPTKTDGKVRGYVGHVRMCVCVPYVKFQPQGI